MIKCTRIHVSVILEQVAEGVSWDQLLADYPGMEKEDIQAALMYARESIDIAEIKEIHA